MAWSKFIIWTGIAYAVYYAFVFLADLLKGVKSGGLAMDDSIDVSGLYADAPAPAEVEESYEDAEPNDGDGEETEEEVFVIEKVSEKIEATETVNNIEQSLVAVHSVGLSLSDLIARQKREAIQATASIQF